MRALRALKGGEPYNQFWYFIKSKIKYITFSEKSKKSYDLVNLRFFAFLRSVSYL